MHSQDWIVLPSEKGAERRRREMFARSPKTVWLGESVFSLDHFLKILAGPAKPIIRRHTQKHLIHSCLKNHPLRYFDKIKTHFALADPFLSAIRSLKNHSLTPENLRERLATTGTLRENDLLTTFERYEILKDKLNLADDEDLYTLAREQLKQPHPALAHITTLTFENFSEKIPALETLLKAIAKTFSKIVIQFDLIKQVRPVALKNIRVLSFASPHQESLWFLQQNFAPQKTGILTGSGGRRYETIWQKLKTGGRVEGPSPFLNWNERPEGRSLLDLAARMKEGEQNLAEWMEELLRRMENDNPLKEWLAPFAFSETLLSLGKLVREEWLCWLKETLHAKPPRRIPEALEGLQWLLLSEGDYAETDMLWVPGLVEGEFPAISPPAFFQGSQDRSTPEWAPLVEAFPDAQAQFEKQRQSFLFQISKTKKECFLTYPRFDSLGRDFFASPLLWDFENAKATKVMPPLIFGPGTDDRELVTKNLETKLKIERERWSDHLTTPAFHADFRENPLPEMLKAQRLEHIFSPSRLKKFAECPFKFFAGNVLDIPEVQEYSPEVDPQDRGDLFHRCLETILTHHGELFAAAKDDPAKEAEFFAKVEAIVEKIFEEERPNLSYANSELYSHLRQKTLQQATQLLKKEMEEAKDLEFPLTPTTFEWKFGEGGVPPLNVGSAETPVLVRGRIDRIDTDDKQKRFMVLDYKTGDTKDFAKEMLMGISLQLPLYILAVQKLFLTDYQPVGGMLVSIKNMKKIHGMVEERFNKIHFKLRKDSASLMGSDAFESGMEQIMEQIRGYAVQIRQGYFSAQPKDCKVYCDYRDICRYAHKPKN